MENYHFSAARIPLYLLHLVVKLCISFFFIKQSYFCSVFPYLLIVCTESSSSRPLLLSWKHKGHCKLINKILSQIPGYCWHWKTQGRHKNQETGNIFPQKNLLSTLIYIRKYEQNSLVWSQVFHSISISLWTSLSSFCVISSRFLLSLQIKLFSEPYNLFLFF